MHDNLRFRLLKATNNNLSYREGTREISSHWLSQ